MTAGIMATSITPALELAQSVRFLSVYLGNPIVFILYFVVMSNNTTEDGRKVLGIKTFRTVDFNTSKMNLFVFLLITLPLYVLWLLLQIHCLVPFLGRLCCGGRRTFNVTTFCDRYASVGSCFVALPGLLNMLVWSTSGMEGNVMGFLFALPLLVAAILYVAFWIAAASASLERPTDVDGLVRYEPVAAGIDLPVV